MKKFTMDDDGIKALLKRAEYGHISTICKNGYPYTVAVHFIHDEDMIYFHGLPKGQKLDNIARCQKVCFTVDELKNIMRENIESPCTADAEYESVVIFGDAKVITDTEIKSKVLRKIVEKYLPHDPDMPIPQKMENGTAVVGIKIKTITGKYHS